jgi:hypothetical protein
MKRSRPLFSYCSEFIGLKYHLAARGIKGFGCGGNKGGEERVKAGNYMEVLNGVFRWLKILR